MLDHSCTYILNFKNIDECFFPVFSHYFCEKMQENSIGGVLQTRVRESYYFPPKSVSCTLKFNHKKVWKSTIFFLFITRFLQFKQTLKIISMNGQQISEMIISMLLLLPRIFLKLSYRTCLAIFESADWVHYQLNMDIVLWFALHLRMTNH